MENNIKKRINTLGKVGYVISIILSVFAIIGVTLSFIGAVAAAFIPGDFAKLEIGGRIESKLSGTLIEEILSNASEDELKADFSDIDSGSDQLSNVKIDAEDGKSISFSGDVEATTFTFKMIVIPLIMCVISCGCYIFVLTAIKKLMKEFKNCDSPFNEGVVSALNLLKISLIPLAVFNTIANTVWSYLTMRYFGGAGGVSFRLDFPTLLVIFVIWIIAGIFKYGCELQRQSDEIL